MARDDFWEHVEEAQEVLKRRAQLQAPADRWQKLQGQVEEAHGLLDLAEEADDTEVLQEVQVETSKLALEIAHFELESLLCGEMDTKRSTACIAWCVFPRLMRHDDGIRRSLRCWSRRKWMKRSK